MVDINFFVESIRFFSVLTTCLNLPAPPDTFPTPKLVDFWPSHLVCSRHVEVDVEVTASVVELERKFFFYPREKGRLGEFRGMSRSLLLENVCLREKFCMFRKCSFSNMVRKKMLTKIFVSAKILCKKIVLEISRSFSKIYVF